MRTIALFAGVLCSSTLFAQAPKELGPVTPGNYVIQPVQSSEGCPVSLVAQHANQGALLAVRHGSDEGHQGYSLVFSPTDTRPIVQARITLHGWSGSHVQPAAEQPGTTKRTATTEAITVAPRLASNNRFRSTVYVHKLTGVQWIELNEVTYADGTQWHEAAAGYCQVVPNGFLLAGAEAKRSDR